jgi:subfamily B ATP-binding cassette protein MsbA
MASIKEIYRYTFSYKRPAFLTIFFNLLYVIFNLVSLILFIPFLQLIFEKPEDMAKIAKPVYHGGFLELFSYVQNSYNYTMQQMVEKDPKDALFFVCITVFIAFFLKNLFRYGAIWHQSQLRMAVVRDLKNKLYNKALRLPMKFYSDERKGDLMARMSSDVGEIEIGVIAILELIFREPFAIITSVTGLIVISPKLTLISFILLPISAFVISRIGRSLKRTAKQGQEQNGIVTSAIDESLSGVKVIKSFSAINFMTEKFEEINLRWQKLITKAFRKRDLSPPLNETLGAAVMICLVWFGGVMILEGGENSLTGKTFIAFIIVFSQLLRPIQGISTSMGNLNKAEPSMDRINEILNADEVINDVPNPIPFKALSGKIEVKHVSFKYKDEWVLQDVSFELEKGKTIALVGESGSGKSTIADLLPRFYDIQSGEILFDGISIEQLKISDLRSSIGIVSQESFLFNETIFNNIAFGLTNVNKEDVMRAAKIAHAHQFIVEMENGYETNIGDRGNSPADKNNASVLQEQFFVILPF